MGLAGVLQEVRMMRFEEVLDRFRGGRLSCEEAADVLGMSVSSFYRWRCRHEVEGAEGLADRRLGRVSARRAPADEVSRVLELFETRYFDFNVKHFHEKLTAEHGIARSYTWTKTTLQAAGKVRKARRRGAHRRRRPRRPLVGMMLHQDGSRHEWVPERWWDLIVTMDDADSTTCAAFFVEEEGTMSSFRGLHETIARFGLFGALYADRASHYWLTTQSGKVDKDRPTQVKRALDQLGCELIPAYSPEARGRSERMFGTLQGRLPQELRLAGITEIEDANRYLAEVFVPAHNRRFREASAEAGSAFVLWAGDDQALADILCVQDERTVGNDNTVRYRNRVLQVPADRHRHHYVRCKVRVHDYPDGTLAVFHGPRCLARYRADGSLIETRNEAKKTTRSAA
jgi:transposase